MQYLVDIILKIKQLLMKQAFTSQLDSALPCGLNYSATHLDVLDCWTQLAPECLDAVTTLHILTFFIALTVVAFLQVWAGVRVSMDYSFALF